MCLKTPCHRLLYYRPQLSLLQQVVTIELKFLAASPLIIMLAGPLLLAADDGHKKVTKLVLDKGADVNANGGQYDNALQALSAGGYEAEVKLLLDNGANVNAQGGPFGNALQANSHEGHEAMVKMLLDKGVDVNAQGREYGNAFQEPSASVRG